MRYIALDTETTGFDTANDRIVEVALVEITEDYEVLGTWVRRINPGIPIPTSATEHHGIRDEDVADLPSFSAHAARIQRILGGATIMAYNGRRFDVPLLDCELRRAGEVGLGKPAIIDPLITFRQQHPYPHSLGFAVRHYCGHEHIGWHSALRDVEGMLEVARAQRAEARPTGVRAPSSTPGVPTI